MRINCLILYLLLIFISFQFKYCYSQTEINNYTIYTTKQGLSSNLIHDLVIDNKGFLWIATANGLNRFDGNKFRQFNNVSDTLAITLDILSIGLDNFGEIYCASKSKDGLIHYHNSKWHKFPFLNLSQRIKTLCIGKILFEGNFIWIITTDGELIKYNKISHKTLFFNSNHDINYRLNFYVKNNDLIFNSPKWLNGITFIHYKVKADSLFTEDTLFSIKNYKITYKNFLFDNQGNIFISLYYKNNNGDFVKEVIFYNRYYHSLATIYKKNGKINLFDITSSKDGQLYIIDLPNITVYDINHNIIANFKVKIYNKDYINLQQILCSNIDKYNNLWIGTDINGLIKINLNSNGFKNYYQSNYSENYIRSILTFKNDLFFGTKNGKIFRIYKKNLLKEFKNYYIPELIDSSNVAINCIGKINRTTIAYQKNNYLYFYNTLNNSKYNSGMYIANNLWTLWSDDKNDIWLGTIRNGFYHYKYFLINKVKYKYKIQNLSNYPFSTVVRIYEDCFKDLWIATDIGLIYLNKEKRKIKKIYRPFNKGNSNFIAKDVWQIYEEKPGFLWIGTTDGGLFSLEKFSGKVVNYLQKDGLPNNTISGILPDNKGNLWIGTINGLSKFNLKDKTFTNYDEEDGLLANDFNFNACSRSDDGMLFWGTKKGIVYFHPDSIHKMRGPLVITSVKVNDKEVKTELFNKDSLILNHDENIFSFEFSLLDFSNPSKWNLEFMLEGFDKVWKKAELIPPSATYTNIPPGNYTFKIRTANFDEHHKREEISIQIKVNPAFWQTTWFNVLILFFIFIFIGFIFYQYQSKAKIKRKMLEVEIDSLRSQMNPHFIFNSLNSIQDFILSNNKESANFYLSKFAKLMRIILENSKKSNVNIDEEIAFLKLYLNLEKMRFNNNLNYIINIDESIDIFNDKIPPMLLQPIIENSIKHGLAPLTDIREISINIRGDKNQIECSVIDNGIGRKAANLNSKFKNEISRGTELINNRLSTLSRIYNKDFHIEIEDLLDVIGNSLGTKVTIYINKDLE